MNAVFWQWRKHYLKAQKLKIWENSDKTQQSYSYFIRRYFALIFGTLA